MEDKNLHINKPEKDQYFSKGNISWEKSEAEVWEKIEAKIYNEPSGELVSIRHRITQWAAAAVLFILVGSWVVVSTYTKNVECLPGEHIVAELPDGSKVELNAQSTLKYYPLKWKIERKVKFEGEGYFSVQKGNKFVVESAKGSTQVLGTSFNIYSRDNNYRVTCITGKVRVSSGKNESVVISPNVHVELEKGKLVVKEMFRPEKALAWKNNEFYFSGRPLKEVFDEIERQYAVTIKLDPKLKERNFGSNFPKKYSVEEVLNIVCKTMRVKFIKQSENVYLIVEES